MAFLSLAQQLFGHNTSANIADALAARIKDPLWFLARQWQTGEFEAENGGRAAVLSITASELAIDHIDRGEGLTQVALDTPLDFAVERESNDGTSPVWNSAALEYGFVAAGDGTRLAAREYTGRNLDWYNFDVEARTDPETAPASVETRIVPTIMTVRGAPNPRW